MPRPNRTGENLTDQAFSDMAEQFDSVVRKNPSLDGVMLRAVRLTDAATTEVPHRLGRAYQGYRIERIYPNATLTAAGTILEDSVTRKETHLSLRSIGFDAPIYVDLWVY